MNAEQRAVLLSMRNIVNEAIAELRASFDRAMISDPQCVQYSMMERYDELSAKIDNLLAG